MAESVSAIGPASHTPSKPMYLGKIIRMGTKTITWRSNEMHRQTDLFSLLELNLLCFFVNQMSAS